MNQAQKIFSDYRKRARLSQREIADLFKISQPTVSLIERGKVTPDAEIILNILQRLKKIK